MLVYKVVDKDYHSIATRGKLEVVYRPGTTVKAPVGLLFCFDTLDHAFDFAENRIILKCETEKIIHLCYMAIPNAWSHQLYQDFWQGKCDQFLHWRTPTGTVGCESLFVIKKVDC